MDFKAMYIFTVFKNKPVYKTAGLTYYIKHHNLHYEGIDIPAIYRSIINYQIKKYGSQLESNRDSFLYNQRQYR